MRAFARSLAVFGLMVTLGPGLEGEWGGRPARAEPDPSAKPGRSAPELALVQLVISRAGSAETMAVNRVIKLGVPQGWTGELESQGRAARLYGPEGEGQMLIAAALHPSELGYYLNELKKKHPSAEPSPPELMKLPGIRPSMGERATRFAIKGREVGEMVLIEKRDTIVLIVTVVDPNAWPRVRRALAKTYPTVAINDVRSPR